MPSATIKYLNDPITDAQFVAPGLVIAGWARVGDVGSLTGTADGNPLTDPAAIGSTRQIFSRRNRVGTLLAIRMRYPGSGTVTQMPVVKAFGRMKRLDDTTDDWHILQNLSAEISITLTTAATDSIGSGSTRLTTVTNKQLFEIHGCNEFLIGVEKVLTMSPTPSIGDLEVRIS